MVRASKAPAIHVSVFNCMPLPWDRDWAELPADAILCILHKLHQEELLFGGVAEVCRTWRRAAREEPELWRRIDVRYMPFIPSFREYEWISLGKMMRAALRLSAGQCHTFFGERIWKKHLLLLAEQPPLLKSLHLIKCWISNEEFGDVIRRFHLLEELEFAYCLGDTQVLELVAGVCPNLRHLRLVNKLTFEFNDSRKAHAIANMRELRSLHIVNDKIDNEGLIVILDNCHHLEYLNICDCFNVNMDEELRSKCARVIVDDYEYLPSYIPDSVSSSPSTFIEACDYYGDDCLHYDYAIDDEDHDMIVDIKGMLRYVG